MTKPLETLVDLQNVMRELRELRIQLEDVPDSMKELHDKHQELSEEIAALEEASRAAETQRRAAEGDAEEAQTKIAHFQEQINKVTTQREYGALLSEIDQAKASKLASEEEALAELEKTEEAQTRLNELRSEFEQIDTDYQAGLAQWEAEKPALAKRIDDLEGREAVLREKLPAANLRLWEKLYERHDGEPMALIERMQKPGDSQSSFRCSVCNYQVRPQVVVQIRTQGELVSCECGRQRIFYIEDVD